MHGSKGLTKYVLTKFECMPSLGSAAANKEKKKA
jgi:hypothetical protein